MEYIPIDNKSALNKVKGSFPYFWDLNIYRGCANGCKYCFALYSHDYLNDSSFFGSVYYKKNIIECLEKELSKKNWKKEIVNIGGVTDSYQEVEEHLKLMPEVLKLMIKYKTPVTISTKSTLILRDIELIRELAKVTDVSIAFTITTIDEDLRKKLEPNTSTSMDRFKAIEELKNTGCTVGVHMMPIIPYLTDNWDNLNKIFELSNRVGADYVLPALINLRGKTKHYFLNFLREYDIDKYNKFNSLYKNNYKEYRNKLYKELYKLKKKHNISYDYTVGISKENNQQLSLLE